MAFLSVRHLIGLQTVLILGSNLSRYVTIIVETETDNYLCQQVYVVPVAGLAVGNVQYGSSKVLVTL